MGRKVQAEFNAQLPGAQIGEAQDNVLPELTSEHMATLEQHIKDDEVRRGQPYSAEERESAIHTERRIQFMMALDADELAVFFSKRVGTLAYDGNSIEDVVQLRSMLTEAAFAAIVLARKLRFDRMIEAATMRPPTRIQ